MRLVIFLVAVGVLLLVNPSEQHVKACFVLLMDNSTKTLDYARTAIGQITTHFNNRYHYPLVVFIEKDFPEDHKSKLEASHSGNVTFAMVDMSKVHNVAPEDLPKEVRGFEGRTSSVGYRSMCRFYSGDAFKHPVLRNYDFLWRIDSDAKYICPIEYDLFGFMQSEELIYGWNQYMYEEPRISADTLWEATQKYMDIKGIKPSNLGQITTIYGGYDRCHYWNNFEVLDLRFFKSPEYLDFYDFLDKEGGFYLYRWGDALVRTVAVHMLLPAEKLHFFGDVGYMHQGRCVNPCKADISCHEHPDPYPTYNQIMLCIFDRLSHLPVTAVFTPRFAQSKITPSYYSYVQWH